MQLNSNLANLQKEIFDAIKYENIDKFKDLGGSDQFDLNFKIEVDDVDRTTYYPIQLAAVKGNTQIIEAILENTTVNINICDDSSGVNSFWLAAFYGHGAAMSTLANAGVDILSKHKMTHANALHISVERNYADIID